MSGAVDTDDTEPLGPQPSPRPPCVELADAREADVGGVPVRRLLPQRTRRTVGAWCFVDHAGSPGSKASMGIGPHPHIGLQTVTWLVEGELLHRDSLGSEQVIRPGQLNLMTAGAGVSHAEEKVAPGDSSGLHAVQLWVAQPEETRHGEAAFEHHSELPRVAVGDGDATVFVGGFAGAESPARADTEHFGAEIVGSGRIEAPVSPDHEHALMVVEGTVRIAGAGAAEGHEVAPGRLAYLGEGRDSLELDLDPGTRMMLLGGVPFPDRLVMWWNYVARSTDEVSAAHTAWTAHDDRFGVVASELSRIDVAPPPWED